MSNGPRSPFRIGSGHPPSPLHTSDSEDTWNHKARWVSIAADVISQWRRFVILRRAGRWFTLLIVPRQLAFVGPSLASFLVPIVPRYWAIWSIHCAIVPSCHRGVALRHLLGTASWSEKMCCQQYFACISNCFLSRVDVRLTGMMAMRWGVIALSPWWGVMRDGHGAMVGRDGHGVLHLNIVPCTLYAAHY